MIHFTYFDEMWRSDIMDTTDWFVRMLPKMQKLDITAGFSKFLASGCIPNHFLDFKSLKITDDTLENYSFGYGNI